MPFEVFKAALSKLPDKTTRCVTFFWRGEPTLDRRLPGWGRIAQERGFYTYTSTNTATPLLHNENYVSTLLDSFDRICFCVDGYDQESVNRYRVGTDWDTLLLNLETISSFETKCRKEMRVLMFRYNESHIQRFIDMAKRYKMDSLRFGLPIINGNRVLGEEEAEMWLAEDRKYQRYTKHDEGWVHRGGRTCNPLPIISVTGEVAPCCYDWQLNHPIGNILHDSKTQINRKYVKVSRLAKRYKLSMCQSDCFVPTFKVNVPVKLR